MESSNSLESIKTLFENLKDVKYIRRNRKVYKFFINAGSLVLNIYTGGNLLETHEIESNIKYDFDACNDGEGNIYIIVINKKYEVQYIRFDGANWNREKIYYLNNLVGIPSSPKIRVFDNVVYIILSFEQPNSKNEWSLRSFIRINNQWNTRVIDRGPGVFYCQSDFFVENGNIHLIYRHMEKYSALKYCFFDLAQGWWEIPKIVLHNGINKYKPNIFVSNEKITCVWIEINGEQLYLTTAKDFSENYFRTQIPKNIKNILLFYSSGHMYGVMVGEKERCFDLCCKKELKVDWTFLIENKEDIKMAEDVRFFLNVKKEIEFENTKLQERVNELEGTLAKTELSRENEILKQEIFQKNNIIVELQETLNLTEQKTSQIQESLTSTEQESSRLQEILTSTEQENSQLHEIVARLSQENEQLLAVNEELKKNMKENTKENTDKRKENNQLLKRIMGFMKKDA